MAPQYVDFFTKLGMALGGLAAVVVAFAIVILVFRKVLSALPPIVSKSVVFLLKLGLVAAMFTFIFDPAAFGFRADLFNNITPGKLWAEIQKLDLTYAAPWLVFAAVAKLAGIFAGIIRWRILLRGQGVHIPFWYLTKCWFWGRAVGLFLPGTLGLDGYRLVESSRYTGEVIKCTTVVAVEKLTGFIALFTLVFLTLPLGFRLFGDRINIVMLGIVLVILAGFILTSLLLLLQPRVIQVVAAVLPLPGRVKRVVNNLGAAVTAYGTNKSALFTALFFGLCVHLGMVFMYFGTAAAVQAKDTGILDILFASPLIIVGQVFAPTVSGAGVREIVMTTVLGAKAGTEKAFLFGHLGLWFGEVVPFVLSLPLLLLTSRPNREELLDDMEAVRKKSARHHDRKLHLDHEEIVEYRRRVFGTLICGFFGGLFAGSIIGLGEAGYLWRTTGGYDEAYSFLWGAAAYGLIFAAIGVGVSAGLLFLYLLFNRFAKGVYTYALTFGATLGAGALIIGLFRYPRDFLGEAAMGQQDYLRVLLFAAGLALVGMVLVYILTTIIGIVFRRNGYAMLLAGVASYALAIAGGYVAAERLQPAPVKPTFTAAQQADGPNVFLIAVDTLRADFLKNFNPNAPTTTPNLDAFAKDAITYSKGFSQASWTKASFGTIFSGLYPECHTATGKISSLPQDVETIAELMRNGGYYTQGYSNNPNIASVFGYDQGFVQYVDLKPSYLFGATKSASDLSMYNVVRRVRGLFIGKFPNFIRTPDRFTLFHQNFDLPDVTIPVHVWKPKIEVTEYYQPAPVVADTTLDWLDNGAPKDNPFFLFAHYMDPHDPFMSDESPDGGYARNALGNNLDPEKFKDPMTRAYIGEIERLDEHLGRFFQGLKDRGLYDNALIIFTADHGEELCDHGGWWHGLTLYNEQIHVPIMVKLPGNQNAGKHNIYMARNLDLAPTILHVAGLPAGSMMQGQSLFGEDMREVNNTIDFSYAENNFEGIVLQAVRDKNDFKLIRANEGNKRELAPVELYEAGKDPGETTNQAGNADYSAIEEHLQGVIDGYLQICEEGAIEPSAPSEASQETQEQLESLGYL
ncbi:MAG: sulfatase-like hydrolase/transferase [Candidatus Hydrogenedens sp.]|nr:sulfatase-like hydrolase/transferase [Candidatus Hydrogenedens sp.]